MVIAGCFLLPAAPALGHRSSDLTLPAPSAVDSAPQTILVHPHSVPQLDWGLAQIIYGTGDDTTHPFGEGAGMVAYDPGRNITLFGGEGSGGLTNATMNYNATTGAFTWTFLDPSPTPRTNFSFATAPSKGFAVLFGGLTGLGSQLTANDTWIYWFGNQTWKNVSSRSSPPARESAAFAVNTSSGTALLEGGFTPRANVGGVSGSILWNDTWKLNLTTLAWTLLSPSSAPPPLRASGLLWDPVTNQYELFGGCGLSCSSTFWRFAGTPGDWTPISATGARPTARAAATFVWDDLHRVALLFGGFQVNTTGLVPLNDLYSFDPSLGVWSQLNLPGPPIPKFDAPSAWADYPGCVGLNIVGGSPTLLGPPPNASVLQPFPSPPANCFPDLYTGVGGPPPPPCSDANTSLSVQVVDAATGIGIGGATVQIAGGCIQRAVGTDPHGYANLSVPSPDTLNFTVIAGGYHGRTVIGSVLPNETNSLRIGLLPFPTLRVRTWGFGLVGPAAPLANVTVYSNTSLELGVSSLKGFLNASLVTESEGNLLLRGVLVNHSVGVDSITVPYTGSVWANLTLLDAGLLTVTIVDERTRIPIPNATGAIDPLDLAQPFPIPLRTGPNGVFTDPQLAAGNYSIAAGAPGYLPNRTIPFYQPWRTATKITLPLEPRYGTDLHVLLVDAVTFAPIDGGTVQILNRTMQTDPLGWANFTNLLPPGPTLLSAAALGYEGNLTYVHVAYSLVLARFVVSLQPLPPCANKACAPGGTSASGPAPFGFLPAAGSPTTLLLLAAPALLLASLLAFAMLRTRERDPPSPGARS